MSQSEIEDFDQSIKFTVTVTRPLMNELFDLNTNDLEFKTIKAEVTYFTKSYQEKMDCRDVDISCLSLCALNADKEFVELPIDLKQHLELDIKEIVYQNFSRDCLVSGSEIELTSAHADYKRFAKIPTPYENFTLALEKLGFSQESITEIYYGNNIDEEVKRFQNQTIAQFNKQHRSLQGGLKVDCQS